MEDETEKSLNLNFPILMEIPPLRLPVEGRVGMTNEM